jgi:Na+/H+-dicarboxylate symporter
VKALVYFQLGTLLALATGLLAINLMPLAVGSTPTPARSRSPTPLVV